MKRILLVISLCFCSQALALPPVPAPVPPQGPIFPGDDWKQLTRDRIILLESKIAWAESQIDLLELILELDPEYPNAAYVRQQIEFYENEIELWSAEIAFLQSLLD